VLRLLGRVFPPVRLLIPRLPRVDLIPGLKAAGGWGLGLAAGARAGVKAAVGPGR
jgi:hypothetical protein